MDIVELIKREHAKTAALFEKLLDSSDGAVKTRERLVSQLKTGLDAHMSVVQDHIYPLLRRNEETRDLVPDLKERNELKRQLANLERAPKDDESFLAGAKELKKAVEQHLRTEERQIFPAIRKAIGGEEAEALAKRIAADTREELQEVKQQTEEAAEAGSEVIKLAANNAAESARRFGKVVERSARNTAEEATETGRRTMDAAAAGARRIADDAADHARRTGRSALDAARIYSETGQRAAEDLRALMTAPTAVAGAVREMQKAWMDWVGQAAQTNARAAQALLRCSTLQEVAEAQRDAMTENLHAWLEGGARVLRTARQASNEALRPLEERIDQTQREERRRASAARRSDAA